MKITVVGSSHGIPEPNRKCTCFMAEIGEKIYFVDMGTSGMYPLIDRGLNPNNVQAVFITHKHGDHTDGLIHFVDLLTWYYTSANPQIFLPNLNIAEAIDTWLYATLAAPKREINYKKIESGEIFNDSVLKVTAIDTMHCPNSHAFLLESEGKRVLFCGDLKKPEIDFPNIHEPIDLIFCEGAHFPVTDYIPILENIDVKRVVINHYSPLFTKSAIELKNALKKRNLPVTLATDNMVFTL